MPTSFATCVTEVFSKPWVAKSLAAASAIYAFFCATFSGSTFLATAHLFH